MSQILDAKWLLCRICLKSENKKLYHIFEPLSDEDIADLGTTLSDKIELCGAITLNQQHNLPNKICNRCLLLLRAAYKFRDLCQQSQEQLKHFFTPAPQKEETVETHEISFDSDAEEQKTEAQEEVSNGLLTESVYDVEGSTEEYDDTSYEADRDSVSKNDYITVIEDDVCVQNFSDSETLQYVVEEVDEFITENNEDGMTACKYEDDTSTNCDNIIIEEHPKKPERQIYLKSINEKKQKIRRKRKNNTNHNFNRVYNCTYCDNTYTDKTKYTNHLKIHIRNKPHECEICLKRFSTTPQLSRHMNSHTGNRPYKCRYCEASFGDPSKMSDRINAAFAINRLPTPMF